MQHRVKRTIYSYGLFVAKTARSTKATYLYAQNAVLMFISLDCWRRPWPAWGWPSWLLYWTFDSGWVGLTGLGTELLAVKGSHGRRLIPYPLSLELDISITVAVARWHRPPPQPRLFPAYLTGDDANCVRGRCLLGHRRQRSWVLWMHLSNQQDWRLISWSWETAGDVPLESGAPGQTWQLARARRCLRGQLCLHVGCLVLKRKW